MAHYGIGPWDARRQNLEYARKDGTSPQYRLCSLHSYPGANNNQLYVHELHDIEQYHQFHQ